jgi:hypothetical protein
VAGLQAGDVIVAIEGEKVSGATALRNRIGLAPVGSSLTIDYRRDGRPGTAKVRIEERFDRAAFSAALPKRLAGASFAESDGKVVVAAVEPDTPASQIGLREGDVVIAVEPLGEEWRLLVAAAGWCWRTPDIGRRLYGIVRGAGFSRIKLEVLTRPDMEGRLLGMIRTVAGYARESGRLEQGRIDAALDSVDRSLADGTFLAIAPQFIVTAQL